ncbi:redoxin domain-containing protein [Rhodopirellula sp. MGV]|uniref:redoxin domain-containing protein n=1 Tax=Rhodopirellula sp. MGV TaxID=2023130 RepID=UPI0018E9876C|nr:redoxin domain-containing protein [Rhodopirellula sp. MGV]
MNRFFCGVATFAMLISASNLSAKEPLAVGDKAPDFELPVQGQDDFATLSELIKDGPVVVVVLRGYPGYQCPLCTRQVSSLVNRAKAIGAATGDQPQRVVLVYPGPENGLERNAKQFLGAKRLPENFVMVRDPDMKMVDEWGLRWNAPRETAYPSTYVIGPGRRVKWCKVSESHAGRSTVEEILKGLRE